MAAKPVAGPTAVAHNRRTASVKRRATGTAPRTRTATWRTVRCVATTDRQARRAFLHPSVRFIALPTPTATRPPARPASSRTSPNRACSARPQVAAFSFVPWTPTATLATSAALSTTDRTACPRRGVPRPARNPPNATRSRARSAARRSTSSKATWRRRDCVSILATRVVPGRALSPRIATRPRARSAATACAVTPARRRARPAAIAPDRSAASPPVRACRMRP